MIDFLIRIHSSEELLSGNSINPADIEIESSDWVLNHIPLILFGNMFDYSILCFYDRVGLYH